ncbi:hypothetical protein DCC79_08635 [bacterium]|nr:MAG: hypothetical protein DCC79_08635 [bacterium]
MHVPDPSLAPRSLGPVRDARLVPPPLVAAGGARMRASSLAILAAVAALLATAVAVLSLGLNHGPSSPTGLQADSGANLGVSLHGPRHAAPRGRVDLRIAITNTGTAAATDVVVTATLGAPLAFAAASDGGQLVAPGAVRWTIPSLAPGAARSIGVAAGIPANAPTGSLVPTTVVVRAATPDDEPDDNGASHALTVTPSDLRVEIGTAAPDVRPGEVVTHTITLHNVSQSAADSVVVTATLGAGSAWVDDSAAVHGFTRIDLPGGVAWRRPGVPGVWSASFDVVTRVPWHALPGSTVFHVVQADAATVDANLGNNVAVAIPLVVVVPDLRLTKTGPPQTAPGGTADFSLAYANRGTGLAPRTRVTDTLPAGMTFVSASPAATVLGDGTLTWDLGRLPAGDEGVIQVRARASAGLAAGATLVNRAAIGSAAVDAVPADNAATAVTSVIAGPPRTVQLGVSPEVSVGTSVEVVADVRDAAGNPVVDDTPVQLSASLGQVQPAASPTRGGRAVFAWRPGAAAGAAVLTAQAQSAQDRLTVMVQPGAPDSVRIVPEPATATVGQTVTLAVEVRDAFGNAVRDGTGVALSAPSGVFAAPTAATIGGRTAMGWRHTGAGTFLITAGAGDVASGVRVTLRPDVPATVRVSLERSDVAVDDGRTQVWASVDDRFGNPVDDGVRVAFECAGGRFDSPSTTTSGGLAGAAFTAGPAPGAFVIAATAGALRGQATVHVQPTDLVIGSRLSGPRGAAPTAQIFPGDPVTYVVTVRNTGPAKARGVVLGTALEERVRLRDVTGSQPLQPIAERANLPKAPSQGYTRHTWSLPDMAPQQTVTVTLRADVEREPTTPWTGFDTLFFRSAITTTTAEASAVDLVRSEKGEIHAPDLYVDLTLDAENSAIRPGGQLAYLVTFGNHQAAQVTDTVITATLPAYTRFDHWQPEFGTSLRPLGGFDGATPVLRWAFDGPYRQNQAFRLWLGIDADAPPESVLQLVAEIGTAAHDVEPFNNTALTAGVRLKGVNLRASVSGPVTAAPGEPVAWQLAVRNASVHDAATDVAVVARLPEGLPVVRVDPPPASRAGDTVRWALEQPLLPGSEQRFTVTAAVPDDARAGTTYTVSMEATSQQRDAFTDDNAAVWATRVSPGPATTLALTASHDTATVCGTDVIQLTASATDRAGNPVADGSVVAWEATGGELSSTTASTLGGKAAVMLRAGSAAGPATVTARLGSLARTADVVLLAGPPGRIVVSADPLEVAWDGTADISVLVTDACANPVADRWPITLAAERGEWPGGDPTIALPTVGGAVAARLAVGQGSGPLRISARHGAVTGAVTVTVGAEPTATPRPTRWSLYVPWARRAGTGARR